MLVWRGCLFDLSIKTGVYGCLEVLACIVLLVKLKVFFDQVVIRGNPDIQSGTLIENLVRGQ